VATQPGEYNAAPVWQRMAIAAAGPLFNIAFTVFAFWAMFVVGRPDFQPVIAAPQGLAAQAGLKSGDRIVAVDGERVDSWSGAMLAVAQAAMQREDATLTVTDSQEQTQQHALALSQLPRGVADDEKTYQAIGLALQPPAAVVGVLTEGPAKVAGLRAGDRIVSINDQAIDTFADLVKLVPEQARKNPKLHLVVARGNDTLGFDIVAEQKIADGKSHWMIGVGPAETRNAIEHYGPLQAVPAAFR